MSAGRVPLALGQRVFRMHVHTHTCPSHANATREESAAFAWSSSHHCMDGRTVTASTTETANDYAADHGQARNCRGMTRTTGYDYGHVNGAGWPARGRRSNHCRIPDYIEDRSGEAVLSVVPGTSDPRHAEVEARIPKRASRKEGKAQQEPT